MRAFDPAHGTGPLRRGMILASVLALFAVQADRAAGQQVFESSVLGGGGGSVDNGVRRLDATLGQSAAGPAANASHAAGIGFWSLNAAATVTGVDDGDPPPARTELLQNTPNPFNPVTTIRYAVGAAGPVSLAIYDLQGREVVKLVDQPQQAGAYEVVFRPQGLASGTYLYRLVTVDGLLVHRMVLLK